MNPTLALRQAQQLWNELARRDALRAILDSPDGEDLQTFFDTGIAEIEALRERIEKLGVHFGGHKALDFGCGVGRLTRALARYFRHVVGVDIAYEMLVRARSLRPPANCSFVLNCRADLRLFRDGSFDLAYSSLTLQHLPSQLALAYLREFVRVVRPGGIIAFNLPSHRVRPGRIRRWVGQSALAILQLLAYYGRRFGMNPIVPMCGIPSCRVVSTLQAAGARLLAIEPSNCAGPDWASYAYYAIVPVSDPAS